MTTLKPSENKREEFRKYLERTGVMDALTKVLVSLYEEPDKPDDALEYIRNKLCSQPNGENLETMRAKLEEANQKITALEKENTELKGESPRPEEPPAPVEEVPVETAAPADPPQ